MCHVKKLICLSLCAMIWGCADKNGAEEERTVDESGVSSLEKADQGIDVEQLALAAQSTSRFVVEPGVGMGTVRFGMPLSEVQSILGRPDSAIGENILQYAGFAVTAKDGKLISIVCGDLNRTDSQFVKNCLCQTLKGIGMGSSEQEIIEAYGPPTRRRESGPVSGDISLSYRASAMRLVLNNDKVHCMWFQKPKE